MDDIDERINKKEEYMDIKVVVLGDIGVGKTSLLNYLVDDPIVMHNQSKTDFKSASFQTDQAKGIIQFWDPAGQEQYRNVPTFIYRNLHACIFVYDVSNPSSLQSIPYWYNDIANKLYPDSPPDIPKLIVAHKNDLPHLCTQSQISQVLEQIEDIKILPASTKKREGRQEILQFVLKNVNLKIKIKQGEEKRTILRRKTGQKDENRGQCCR